MEGVFSRNRSVTEALHEVQREMVSMATTVLDMSMSLDGFIAGPNDELDRVHAWQNGGGPGHGVDVVEEMHRTTGAVVMGRRNDDISVRLDERAQLAAAVDAAEAALAAAIEREYAEECALHYARQAARTASAEQIRQADAWCAAADDQLHKAIVDVQRTTAQLRSARHALVVFQSRSAA